jgi:hypothetical protein
MNFVSRQSYITAMRREVALPAIRAVTIAGSTWAPSGPENYIGAFGLAALAEIGIWSKLLHSAGLPSRVLMIDEEPKEGILMLLRTSFAPSRLQDVLLVKDPQRVWRGLIQPDTPERAFAMHVREGKADPLMLGLPTEEAWDMFRDLANH